MFFLVAAWQVVISVLAYMINRKDTANSRVASQVCSHKMMHYWQ